MRKLKWPNVLFFGGVPVVAVIGGTYHIIYSGLTWAAVAIFFGMLIATLGSITAGYHRLYAHRCYKAAGWLKLVLLIFGAGAIQESCLKWSSEHRVHHRHVDHEGDPYNIRRGFFWAHVGWIISAEAVNAPHPKDLKDDPLVMWQHRWWLPVGIVVSFGLPTLLGALAGDILGGFFFGGFLRLAVAHHLTFMINSLAHTIGSKPYSLACSAKDSWITALLSFGEGYHNYHHWYARDYRNGIRWYHWDPGKWFIWAMSWIRQAKDLKRASDGAIYKARLETDHQRCTPALSSELQECLNQLYQQTLRRVEEYMSTRQSWLEAKRNQERNLSMESLSKLKLQYKKAKRLFKEARQNWNVAVQEITLAQATA